MSSEDPARRVRLRGEGAARRHGIHATASRRVQKGHRSVPPLAARRCPPAVLSGQRTVAAAAAGPPRTCALPTKGRAGEEADTSGAEVDGSPRAQTSGSAVSSWSTLDVSRIVSLFWNSWERGVAQRISPINRCFLAGDSRVLNRTDISTEIYACVYRGIRICVRVYIRAHPRTASSLVTRTLRRREANLPRVLERAGLRDGPSSCRAPVPGILAIRPLDVSTQTEELGPNTSEQKRTRDVVELRHPPKPSRAEDRADTRSTLSKYNQKC